MWAFMSVCTFALPVLCIHACLLYIGFICTLLHQGSCKSKRREWGKSHMCTHLILPLYTHWQVLCKHSFLIIMHVLSELVTVAAPQPIVCYCTHCSARTEFFECFHEKSLQSNSSVCVCSQEVLVLFHTQGLCYLNLEEFVFLYCHQCVKGLRT